MKNMVFEALRPRKTPKTSFLRLCDLAKRQKHCFRDFATSRRVKNVVFETLRPRNAPKTLFLKLCGPHFVPFRGLNDLSRPRFIPLRTLNDPLRARVAPLRALNDPLRPRFVPLRGLNDLSRARVAPLRGLNDPLRPRVAPLRGLNAHCDLALCQNHPTISSPVARKVPAGEWGQYGVKSRKMRESA